jgi:hypothetical protein
MKAIFTTRVMGVAVTRATDLSRTQPNVRAKLLSS